MQRNLLAQTYLPDLQHGDIGRFLPSSGEDYSPVRATMVITFYPLSHWSFLLF